jgi:hypothetical protein
MSRVFFIYKCFFNRGTSYLNFSITNILYKTEEIKVKIFTYWYKAGIEYFSRKMDIGSLLLVTTPTTGSKYLHIGIRRRLNISGE